MPSQPLAPAVASFITAHVTSLDDLEVMMLLVSANGRWWDATSTARELGLSVGRARAALDALATHNLLDIRISDDVRYQFRPGTVELEEAALAVAAAYRRRPSALVQFVGGRASRSVRDFADAFRIRRRDDG